MPEESGGITAEQLMAAAEQYDAAIDAGETPEVAVVTEEPKPEATPEGDETPTGEEAVEQDSGQDTDETPDGSLTEGEPPEAKEQPEGDSKWAKNESRKNRTWKEINSTKEEIKREREALEEERRALESRRSEIDEGKAYRDDKGFTAEDYEAAAERLREDGDVALAQDALEKAESVRQAGKQSEEDRAVRKAQEDWERTRDELQSGNAELKNPDAPLTKTANQILKDHPDLMYLPEGKGLRHAVQIAEWKLAAEKVDASAAEANELREKLDKLEKKMSVDGGYTGERPDGSTATFDDLSDGEQEAYLRKAAAALDDTL